MIAVAIVMLALPLSALSAQAYTTETKIADIITEGGSTSTAIDLGDIYAWNVGSTLYVKFVITVAGWDATSAQIDVRRFSIDIPHSNGSPVPGQFSKKFSFTPVTEKTFSVSLPSSSGDVSIAVHLNVRKLVETTYPDVNTVGAALPDQVTMSVTCHGTASYFITTIYGPRSLAGTYAGGCLDIGHSIVSGVTFTANVYSIYETLPAGINIDHPENLDLVNWVLNQNFIGKTAADGYPFTFGDVQEAIWQLVDDQTNYDAGGPWRGYHVTQILALAAGHDGYVPGAGEGIVVILQPINTDANGNPYQVSFILICPEPTPVYRSNTGWGVVGGISGLVDGMNEFPGSNWAEYIPYTIT